MLKKLFKNKFYKKHRAKFLMSIDIIIILFSYVVAYWAKIEFDFIVLEKIRRTDIWLYVLMIVAIYIVVFSIFGIYKSLWKFITTKEVMSLTLANLIATGIVMCMSTALSDPMFYLSIEFVASVFAILMMFSFRATYRLYRRYTGIVRKEENDNIVIIGAGEAGVLLLKEIIQNDNLNYNVIGFVDDQRAGMRVAGLPVLGTTDDLEKIRKKYNIDIAILAIKNITKDNTRRIIAACQKAQCQMKIMTAPEEMINDDISLNKKLKVEDVKIEDLLGRGEVKLQQEEIKEYISNKVVCVTGAGGSIGSELCRQILKFNPELLVLIDINENELYMLEQEIRRNSNNKSNFVSIIASIRDRKALENVFELYKPQVVYHAAAHKHVPLMETRPMEAIKNNVFGTNNLIKSCIKYNVERFIMISTDKAVNPTNVMGATKRMTEMILQAYGNNSVTKMAAVRFGNVLGSNGSVIPIFKKQIENGGPVTITHKNITRYFMTIPEASQLVLQAGYYADSGEIFVLDMGEPVKILDLAEKLIRLSGYEPYTEIEIKEVGLRPGEKMYEELHLANETFEKTKNDLIFKNHVLKIECDRVEEILKELNETINKENVTNLEIREKILDVIIDD